MMTETTERPGNVAEMPEVLAFVSLMQETQVFVDEKPMWGIDAMDALIAEAARKAAKYKKGASVSMDIRFLPGEAGEMTISISAEAKTPKPGARPRAAYTDNQGRLYSEDVQQMKMKLPKPARMNDWKNEE